MLKMSDPKINTMLGMAVLERTGKRKIIETLERKRGCKLRDLLLHKKGKDLQDGKLGILVI